MRSELALLLVFACTPSGDGDPKKKKAAAPAKETKKLDTLAMKVPEGWTSEYLLPEDSWRFRSGSTVITFERTSSASANSPEALRHYLKSTADITSREATSDGFVATFSTFDVYVMKEIYNEWFRCFSNAEDPVLRDQVIALCKSIKAPR